MTKQKHLIVGPQEEGNVEFGEVIRRLRDKAQLTRVEAADKLDLSPEYIRLIELGKRVPALGTLRMILKTYGFVYHVDKNRVAFDTFVVEFTSRIQEARRIERRDAVIGEIMRLLIIADDTMLRDVRKQLRKS